MNEATVGCFSKPFASSPEAAKDLLSGITKLLAKKDLHVALPDFYFQDPTVNVHRRLVPFSCVEAAQANPAVLVAISEFLDAGVCKFRASVVDVDSDISIGDWDDDSTMLDVSMPDTEAEEEPEDDDEDEDEDDENDDDYDDDDDDDPSDSSSSSSSSSADDDEDVVNILRDEGPGAPGYLDLTSNELVRLQFGFPTRSIPAIRDVSVSQP